MSTTPMGASITPGVGPLRPEAMARYAESSTTAKGLMPQGISRRAHRRQVGPLPRGPRRLRRREPAARRPGHAPRAASTTRSSRSRRAAVDKETGKVIDVRRAGHRRRGHPPTPPLETLANLKPAFKPDGKVTAGNSSQITDGASAVLIMSEEKANELGLTPRARFHTFALAGVDPVIMLTGPIPATDEGPRQARACRSTTSTSFEVNEAFASVVLAWEKEHNPDMSKVNVNGGAIALGHPLGGSGAKLMATLLNELERTGGRYGLQTMCEGGGLANATIIERLWAEPGGRSLGHGQRLVVGGTAPSRAPVLGCGCVGLV